MIGGNPRGGRTMNDCAQWMDRPVNKNMIDTEHRKSRGEGANGRRCPNEVADITHVAIQSAIWARTAQAVKITKQNKRDVTGYRSLPLRVRKQLCLNEPFAPAETKVRVDDADLSEIGFNLYFNRRASFTAKKWWAAR